MTTARLIKNTLIICATVLVFLIVVGGVGFALYNLFRHRPSRELEMIAVEVEASLKKADEARIKALSDELIEVSPDWPPPNDVKEDQDPFGGLILEP